MNKAKKALHSILRITLFFLCVLPGILFAQENNLPHEDACYKPLHENENKAANDRIPHIDWDVYTYSVILVPGYGPKRKRVNLSPVAKRRLKLAVDKYHQKLAPVIVVSGGNVHPDKTPYNEAFEMKKHLMDRYEIPEEAILAEPYARHTTTNFRNTCRLIFCYAIPADKTALVTTTLFHRVYFTKEKFTDRCCDELGYLPILLGKQLNRNDVEFLPQIESLGINALDSLDP